LPPNSDVKDTRKIDPALLKASLLSREQNAEMTLVRIEA
jgi:hypothetical protein